MTTVLHDPALVPPVLLQQLPVSVDVLVVLAVVVVALVLFIFQPVAIDVTAIALMVVLIIEEKSVRNRYSQYGDSVNDRSRSDFGRILIARGLLNRSTR